MVELQKVRDIMVRSVISVSPKAELSHAARLMRKYRIGSVLVIERGRMRGIITESDFIKFAARGYNIKNRRAEDYMTRNVITCDSSVTVIDALMIMRRAKVRHLPVVKNRKVVGVISLRDLIAATQLSSLYVF